MTRERKCMASSDNSASPGQQQEVDPERCCGYPEEEAPCGAGKCPGKVKSNELRQVNKCNFERFSGNILMIVGGKVL